MIKAFVSYQFLGFLITGGIAALVNFCSRIFYNLWLDFSISVIAAYITGMITAFILAKVFVFKKTRQSVNKSALLFVAVNGVAVLQTWVISVALAYYALPQMGLTKNIFEIAHACGVIIPVFTSYLGHKHFSFK